MLISFEGVPGTRKTEIFNELVQSKIFVKDFNVDIKGENIFKQQLIFLSQLQYNYEMCNTDELSVFNSSYSLKEVYANYLLEKKMMTKQEFELFNYFHTYIFKKPDYIIYLHGDTTDCFKRFNKNVKNNNGLLGIKNEMDYLGLYTRYEMAFDITNCDIPIYKVSVDDGLPTIISNILKIFDDIVVVE